MSRTPDRRQPIEARLDALIDALNAGEREPISDDRELSSFATIARAIHDDDVAWPDPAFPDRLSARVYSDLGFTDQPLTAIPPDPDQSAAPDDDIHQPTTAAAPAHLPESLGPPAHAFTPRRLAQIAAAIVGFGLLTLVLAAVFRGFDGDEPTAVGDGASTQGQIAFVKDVYDEDNVPNDGAVRDPDGNAEIFLINADGSGLTNLTNHPADDRAPAWSPDGQMLAFVSDRSGRDQIYLMAADGSNVRQVTEGDEPSEWPSWSPDRSSIAFLRHVNGVISPWIMNADGADQRPLDTAPEASSVPTRPLTWSPDGELIAYRYRLPEGGIGISSADGTQSRMITLPDKEIGSIDWSADTRWLAIAPYGDGNDIALLDATTIMIDTTAEPILLTDTPDLQEGQADWSPDGEHILFVEPSGPAALNSEQGVYVSRADGSEPQLILTSSVERWIISPQWSPDGSRIALTRIGEPRIDMEVRRQTGDTFELVVVNADGSGERVLADDIWSVWNDPPAWRPDSSLPDDVEEPQPTTVGDSESSGLQLAVTMQTDPVNGNPDIFLVDLDGSEPVNLTNHPAIDTMPAWSPDGKRLAFISDRSGSDRLYVSFTDGRGVRLIDPMGYVSDPASGVDRHLRNLAYSPDGSKIAVMRFAVGAESTDAEVLIVASDGRGLRVVDMENMDAENAELVFDQTPVWSPDSQWLLFEVRIEGEDRLAVSGRWAGYHPLPLPEFAPGTVASWSVNDEIAVAGEDGVTILEFTGDPASLASEEVRQLPAPDAGPVTGVEWSPDGSQLAVSVGGVSGATIWIVSADGSSSVEVPDSLTGIYPRWSPDGSQLAFLRFGAFFSADSFGYELMLYDLATSTLTRLVDTKFSGPLQSPAVWRIEPVGDYSQSPTAVPTATSADEAENEAEVEQAAIEQVRAFLDDPAAELTVDSIDESSGQTIVEISRPIPGVEDSDQFAIDIDAGTIFTAILQSNSTLVQPQNPVTVDEARTIAEAFHQEHNTFSVPLMVADELRYSLSGTTYDGHGVIWQAMVNGVWLPTTVVVVVDLETGLVIGYSRTAIPYDGTLTPAID